MKYFYRTLLSLAVLTQLSAALDLPKEMTLEYSGPYGIPATLKFKHDDQHYSIITNINIPFKNMRFVTQGIIKNDQLMPTQYSVYRSNELYSSAQFDYQKGTITYGKLPTQKSEKLPQLTQDLFSIAWQMSVNQKAPKAGTYATNGKKLYSLQSLDQKADKQHYVNNKKEVSAYYVGGEGDKKIEVGLAKNLYFVPSFIVYYDKGKRYELELRRLTTQ